MGRGRQWWQLVSELRDLFPRPRSIWDRPAAAPQADICDAPLICVSFNTEWASFFSGAIGALLDRRYWQFIDDAEYQRIEQSIERILEQMVQPCSEPSNGITLGEAVNNVQVIVSSYDGTPSSVNYLAPDDQFDFDADDNPLYAACRENALCRAAEAWVGAIVQNELARRANNDDWIKIAAFVPGAIVAAGFSTAAFLVPWLGLAALGVGAMAEFMEQAEQAALEDICAQKAVACCLRDHLAGQNTTFEVFMGALDVCDGLSANAEAIRAAIAHWTHEQVGYQLFLVILGATQGACLFGDAYGCGCDFWCHLFDFTLDDGGFTQAEGAGGLWEAGIGWIHGDKSGIGIAAERRVKIVKFTGSTEIRYMQIGVQYEFGHIEPSEPLQWFESKHGGAALISKNASEVPNGLVEFEWFGVNVGSGLDIFIRSSYDDVFPKTFDGSVTIKYLKLAGCGANPFGDCNNCLPPPGLGC